MPASAAPIACRFLDQHVLALHRIDAVGAILVARAAGPFRAHPPHRHAIRAVDFQRVALGVFNRQVFDRESVGSYREPCRTALLILKRQDSLVDALAPDGHVLDRERERAVHIQAAFGQFDHRAGFGGNQRFLEFLLEIGPGGKAGIFLRARGQQGETQRGREQGGSSLGHVQAPGGGLRKHTAVGSPRATALCKRLASYAPDRISSNRRFTSRRYASSPPASSTVAVPR